jgi:2-isopropylmalate synthase
VDDEQFERVYERFLNVADKKKTVDTRDLESIVADETQIVFEDSYELEHVQVSCGDHSIPTATVQVRRPNGEISCDADHGTGPVDAVFGPSTASFRNRNELIVFSRVQAV